jgi:DNA-binding CsgD family transcriptional regulator
MFFDSMSDVGRSAKGVREADVRAMLTMVAEVAGLERSEDFGPAVLPGLRELVPSHIASYNEVRTDRGTMVAADDPPGSMTADAPEVFPRLAHENPIFTHFQETRDGRPYKWSDFFTRRELHATDLYREAYGPMRVEYQMAFCLPTPPELVIGFALNREHRDFAERDRTVLNLVRAPLISALAAVERYAALVGHLAAVERGLERDGIGVIVLEGEPAQPAASFISGQAAHALDLEREDGKLPDEVVRWLEVIAGAAQRRGPRPPLLLSAPDGGELSIDYLPGRKPGEPDALLVEREPGGVSIDSLRGAGLTARQAEVLQLVALGNTDAAIAAELGISARTVGKHLENIYEQLGATSRTQALVTAWSIERRRRVLTTE